MNHHPDLKEKLFFLFSGAIISTPFPFLVNTLSTYFLSMNLSRFWAFAFSAAFVAPPIEEFAKAYPLFYRHGETEKSLFLLGFLTGLGFGISEFLLYVFINNAPAFSRLPAVLFHACSASIIAYGIARNRAFNYYFIAVALHFLYNFSSVLGTRYLLLKTFALVTVFLFSLYLSRKTTNQVAIY